MLLAISTSGNSSSIVEAIRAAHGNELHVVALTGKGGGEIGQILHDSDVTSASRRTVPRAYRRSTC